MTEPRKNQTRTKWDSRRVVVAVLALIMAALMLLPLVSNVFLYGFAITQDDINALKQQKANLASQQSEAKKTLSDLEQQENSAMERLNAIEEQIGLLADQINATQDIIDDYDVLIAQSQDELAKAQADEDLYYQRVLERVRGMEEEGTVSYWEIIFKASNFSDLLDRFTFVNDVMKYDNDTLEQLDLAREAVAAAEEKLEQEQAEQEQAKQELQTEQAEQEDAAEQEEKVLQEILDNEAIYSQQIAALSAQQEDLVGQISAAERQYAEEQARKALEEQRRREAEERRRQEEAARKAAEERERQEAAERERQQAEQEQAAQAAEQQQEDAIIADDMNENVEEEVDLGQALDTNDDNDLTLDDDNDTEVVEEEEDEEPVATVSSGKNPSASVSGSNIVSIASQYVGNSYVWGGNSLTGGIDCSGFVHAVLAKVGVSSPRQSAAFRSFGKAVSVENMQVGDIVCYSGHVGFYAGGGQLLSALGSKYGITYCSVYYKPILAVRRA